MALLLGIDLETTGLDPTKDKIIEVGMALWDTSTDSLIRSTSYLVCKNDIGELHNISGEINAITGISNALFSDFKTPFESKIIIDHWTGSDCYLVAHNAEFEKSFLKDIVSTDKPWIDTKTDIPYKPMKGKGTLSDICMSHGIFNPMPHRALFDVIAMLQVLAKYPFEEVEKLAQSPTYTLDIKFPYDPTKARNEAVKALGYYWNDPSKSWQRKVKQIHLMEATQAATASGFTATVVEL